MLTLRGLLSGRRESFGGVLLGLQEEMSGFLSDPERSLSNPRVWPIDRASTEPLGTQAENAKTPGAEALGVPG